MWDKQKDFLHKESNLYKRLFAAMVFIKKKNNIT